jgi:hypothetical protein
MTELIHFRFHLTTVCFIQISVSCFSYMINLGLSIVSIAVLSDGHEQLLPRHHH